MATTTEPRGHAGHRKTQVAIVGTGMAGLTTAFLLHNDPQKRYEVTLFEQVCTHDYQTRLRTLTFAVGEYPLV